MATRISSKEVLVCLNHLGYDNVNAQQLKEFVRDLKKLIKYEEKKRSKEKLELLQPPKEPVKDIFAFLHSEGTCASKAKVASKKESVISLQIKKSKCQLHSQTGRENKVLIEDDGNVERLQEEPVKEKPNSLSSNSKVFLKKKPGSSFIRPTVPVNVKGDPVALYHFYKAGWKRQKVPGEDNRTELRWAIREKMSKGPSVTRA